MANMLSNFGTGFPLAASGSPVKGPGSVIGFLCTVTGTITLYDNTSASGTPFLNAFPVTAGQFVPIACAFAIGLTVVLAGGAQGTIIVGP